MKSENKKTMIGIILFILLFLTITNAFIFLCETEVEDVEHNALITMKWKISKLLGDHHKFELDNSTETYVEDYEWYKYDEGDIYTWYETEYIFPNWWLLW